ncbi:MAG TPA: glycosyltransferase [Gammaproteobacteria bacterium]|nr:glycosyltransferase [Gammaproteobacteria bacterium]
MQPRISIIMPIFNRADTVERALLSIKAQTYKNIELIVLDAGSTDGTLDVLKRYESEFAYFRSQPDKGAADATNEGLKRVTGDFVGLLMADDTYEPGIIEAAVHAYQANPKLDMISFGARIVMMDKGEIKTLTDLNDPSRMKLNFWNITIKENPSICSRFIKRSFYERVGPFNAVDDSGVQILSNDRDFMLRAVLARVNDTYLNQVGYNYFAHAGSYSFNSENKSYFRHCQEHVLLAKKFMFNKNLNIGQRCVITYWYFREWAKLVCFKLFGRSIKSLIARKA